MKENKLFYTVEQNEFIVNWLVSKVVATPFHAKMLPMQIENYHPGGNIKGADGKEKHSPAKSEFLKKELFKNAAYPYNAQITDLYWPFDTKRVDFSGFWHRPCGITFYAKAYIQCESECIHELEIYTCGAVRLWVNEVEQASFYPYESNIETFKKIKVKLSAGTNIILVGCNNYGERNIIFNFGIKNLGSSLKINLPVDADIKKMKAVNTSLQAMYLDKLSYSDGDIVACTDEPLNFACTYNVLVCGHSKQIEISTNQQKLVLAKSLDLPIGYHEFVISCDIDGVVLRKTFWAENYPANKEIATPQSFEARRNLVFDFIINNTQPSLEQYIAWLAKGENRFEQYEKVIFEIMQHIENRGDCSDFRVAKIIWILIKFRSLLTNNQIDYFEKALLEFRYWFDEKGNDAMWFFSENHALCFHTCEMLAGELLPKRIFTNSEMSGIQHSAKAKELIVEWFLKLLKYGYNEWNSAAYIPVDILSYVSLFELCKDSEIKSLAKQALDYTYEIFAKNSFQGLMATSNGRTYPRDLLANKNLATNPLLWLAFGQARLNSHVDPIAFLALSDYLPSQELQELANWDSEQQLIIKDFQGTYKVPTVLCKTKDYIIGTSKSPRTGGPGSQEHLCNVFIKDCQSRIWVNHPGEGKIFGEKRPGYFTGNGLTPSVSQHGNLAVLSYNFCDELLAYEEVNFTHAFCDMSVCDEVIITENWAFFRRDNTFVALFSKNGLSVNKKPPLKDLELISPQINTTWIIKVSTQKEFTSFEFFVNWHIEKKPIENNNILYLEDYEYGKLEFNLMDKEMALREYSNTMCIKTLF